MSARALVPAAHSREEPPAAAAEELVSSIASRQAEQLPSPDWEGKEAAREERAATATSAGARGEPSPAPVLGHSVPQAAVPVRPLALHLAHKALGPGGPFGGEPPPPPPSSSRDPPAEDAWEEAEAAAGPEEKPQLPLPPKENPWTKRPPQHLAPSASELPLSSVESGLWLLRGGHRGGVCTDDSRGGRGYSGAGGKEQASSACQSEAFYSKVSFTLRIYINGHLGPERQEEVGPRLLLDRGGGGWGERS